MFKFWRNKIREKQQIEAFEERLCKSVARLKPELSTAKRNNLKKSLLATIKTQPDLLPSSLQGLVSDIKRVGNQLQLPLQETASLKERVIGLIEGGYVSRGSLNPIYGFKAVLSGALLIVFVASSVFLFPNQVPVTYAHGTYLSELYGDVYVLRNSELVKGRPFQDLSEGDVVLTKDKSFATIHFFDDSLGRLSENTNLQIRRLYTEPLNPLVTQVELFLKQGHMWAKVINLVDDNSSFAVDTKQAQAKVTKKAAFDIADQGNSTTLTVFDNVVDVVPVDKTTTIQPKTVVAGYQAQVSTANFTVALQSVSTSELIASNYAPWVTANLSRDQVYDQKLLADKEAIIKGEDGGNDLNGSVTDLGDIGTLSNVEIEEAKRNFLQAYLDFKKGETMLARGFHKEGIEGLGKFRQSIKDLIARLPEFKAKDPFNTDLLLGIVQEKIALQLKDLAGFLPGDRLYVAKEALQQLQIMISQTTLDQTQIRLSQAEGKLLEMQELVKSNKLDLAITVLHNYQSEMDQFVVKISPDNFEEFKDKLTNLVDQQVQQIKVLTALEQAFNTPEANTLKQQVRDVRYQTLLKLINALDKLAGLIPVNLLLELKDVVDTYMVAGTKDDEIVRAAFVRLLKNYLKDTKDKNIKVPKQLGVLLIVTQESTQEATTGLEIHSAAQPAQPATPATPATPPVPSQSAELETFEPEITSPDTTSTEQNRSGNLLK